MTHPATVLNPVAAVLCTLTPTGVGMLFIDKGAGSGAGASLWETAAILVLCFAVIVAVLLVLRAFRHKRNARTLD
jgi:hypothetical protein